MIVKTVVGDAIKLFKEGKFDAFAHGCNCFCTMGKGLAKQVKKDLEELYRADVVNGKRGNRGKLGGFSNHQFSFGVGFNLYTQYTFWDMSDMLSYEAVERSFKKVNDYMKSQGLKTLVIPKIGSRLAHGDWEILSNLIDLNSPDIEITVVEFVNESNTGS